MAAADTAGEGTKGRRRQRPGTGTLGRSSAVVIAGLTALALLTTGGLGATAAARAAAATTGSLSGRITEATVAAVIGDVCVRATGPSSASAVSSGGGTFTISRLAPGSYTVTADPTCGGTQHANFLPAHRSDVAVRAGTNTKAVDLALPPVRPATEIGVVPPAAPESNCAPAGSDSIIMDECRALEGVGQLTLPSNYGKLSGPEQMLVLFDLERVNRGLPPVVGLSATLDNDAKDGAAAGDDPTGPGGYGWASIWAGGYGSVEASDWAWMYDDGYPGPNEDCSSPSAGGCWGHRDAILLESSADVVGGGGLVTGSKAPYGYSAAFLFVSGYPTSHLVFTWSSELKYFKTQPRLEPAARPTVSRVTPASGRVSGGTTVRITGTNLFGVSAVDFGAGHRATVVSCDGTSCTVRSPKGSKGRVDVTVTTLGGTSALHTGDRYTYD